MACNLCAKGIECSSGVHHPQIGVMIPCRTGDTEQFCYIVHTPQDFLVSVVTHTEQAAKASLAIMKALYPDAQINKVHLPAKQVRQLIKELQ